MKREVERESESERARLKWMLWLIATEVNIPPYREQCCHDFTNSALCLFNSPLTSVFYFAPAFISLPHPSICFQGSCQVNVPYPHEVKVPGFCSNYRSMSGTKALTRLD